MGRIQQGSIISAVENQDLDPQTTTSPPIVEQAQGQDDAAQVKTQEWEIIKILNKMETRLGTEYLVRWENTWLPKGELGNARKVLREFEANGQARHGCKRRRLARADKLW